jgi:nitroimidazol reductase NimA-like FMN-containing flavoprotein (pyridoxamine 5'-phosphate oxidase superfamily)
VSFTAEQAQLLDLALLARLGFAAADGWPRVIPIWYVREDGELLMTTGAASFKARRLRADPRAAVEVSTPERPYRELEASGTVTLEPLADSRKLDVRRRIARRYLSEADAEVYARLPYEVVLVRFRPVRLRYVDHARGRPARP